MEYLCDQIPRITLTALYKQRNDWKLPLVGFDKSSWKKIDEYKEPYPAFLDLVDEDLKKVLSLLEKREDQPNIVVKPWGSPGTFEIIATTTSSLVVKVISLEIIEEFVKAQRE